MTISSTNEHKKVRYKSYRKGGSLRSINTVNKKKILEMNTRGQQMAIQILFLLMTVGILVAVVPYFIELMNLLQQSDYLNCPGYLVGGNANNTLSYNNSLPSNSLSCLSIRLFIPYLILAILIAGVAKLISGRLEPIGGY